VATAQRDNNNGDIYTPAQRERRNASVWTLVQGVLAPLQFMAFALSLVLVINYLANGTGYWAAVISVLVKTGFLYAIMVTGAIWEKVVFGRYLFAQAFFWEDVVSMLVIGLHTAYILVWWLDALPPTQQMWLAVVAYGSYVINALQFLIKFKGAREQGDANSRVAALDVTAGSVG